MIVLNTRSNWILKVLLGIMRVRVQAGNRTRLDYHQRLLGTPGIAEDRPYESDSTLKPTLK